MNRIAFLLAAALFLACGSTDPVADGSPGLTDARLVPDARPALDAPPGTPDATPVVFDAPTENPDANPNALSLAGLYSDFASRTVDPRLRTYVPLYPLWADNLGKNRYLDLPAGQKIDTTDMDHWVFPVGTRFWKEFAETDGTPLETRLIEKTSDSTWKMGSYVWLNDNSDAIYTENGARNVHGTDWDVPSLDQCQRCHDGELDHFLGFSAIQLGDGEVKKLADASLLNHKPAQGQSFALPWDDHTNAAVGMFYGNCSHCHSTIGSAAGTGMNLRVTIAELAGDPPDAQFYKTTVGIPTSGFMSGEGLFRVSAHDVDHTAVLIRMSSRESLVQMPPIATKHVDTAAVTAVTAWVGDL